MRHFARKACDASNAEARGSPKTEVLRWAILLGAGLLLTLPYIRPERVGAGDAQDYAQHLADFIVQVEHGVFPVLVGQSPYAVNGAFNPLRTAPYLQYLGGALHALTFGRLRPFALQNLEIVLSLCAAGFSCYLCLGRISGRRGWPCLLLSLLYLTSPGVLALVYGGDMIPSWLTLPYLPICAYLLVRIAEGGVTGGRLAALATVMAIVWSAHAPIAMWLSFIGLPAILVRLLKTQGLSKGRAALVGVAALGVAALGVFATLAGFEFASVVTLDLPALPNQVAAFRNGVLLSNLEAGWAGFLHPVSTDGGNLLADLQLSAGLWVCLLAGVWVWRRGGWGLRVLLTATGCLLVLLAPMATVAGRLWTAMPGWVDQITDQWPMQRFYPILSAFAPFAGVLALRSGWPDRPRARAIACCGLAAACVWSGFEARKFLSRGFRVALPHHLSRLMMRAENAVPAIYSYGMLGAVPASFSYGPIAPNLALHLLDPATLTPRRTNVRSLLGNEGDSTRTLPFAATVDGAAVQANLKLLAGTDYLLKFTGADSAPAGTLVLRGRHIWRNYPFPRPGGPSASPFLVALAVPETSNEFLTIQFFSANGAPVHAFSGVTVIPYATPDLPVHVLALFPYRLSANAPTESWLETTRIFIPGYRATVDGKPAEIARSPNGLVMVRIPAGESTVQLDYPGPLSLRVAFAVSFLGWLLAPFAWWVWLRRSRMRAPEPA